MVCLSFSLCLYLHVFLAVETLLVRLSLSKPRYQAKSLRKPSLTKYSFPRFVVTWPGYCLCKVLRLNAASLSPWLLLSEFPAYSLRSHFLDQGNTAICPVGYHLAQVSWAGADPIVVLCCGWLIHLKRKLNHSWLPRRGWVNSLIWLGTSFWMAPVFLEGSVPVSPKTTAALTRGQQHQRNSMYVSKNGPLPAHALES